MTRNEFITRKLRDLLDRRTPPTPIRGKPVAQREEAAALLRAVLRNAPPDAHEAWWAQFEDRLLAEMTTYSWPTPGLIEKVGRALAPPPRYNAPQPYQVDRAAVAAKRLTAGEPVSEFSLFGRDAIDLQRRGLATRELLDRYRHSFFLHMKEVHGEAKAVAAYAERCAKHNAECDGLVPDEPEYRTAPYVSKEAFEEHGFAHRLPYSTNSTTDGEVGGDPDAWQ